ncbi:MAG: 16S rRNA (guanine(966)-N(2))-methyltransferase RsmD [Clostridia bacterium]|nr:16S rRNA (guanine(966)-N(2))-methyltransferase RsmD [Clostridia bacterium]
MRIISGSRRGRKLISFEGNAIRPTTDRVKESLFNLIQDYVSGSRVLDLFGGSGALALEALSRGAAFATIVDKDKKAVELIRKNVELTGFEELCDVCLTDAKEYILQKRNSFDIIFLDPPYNKGFVIPVLCEISSKGILNGGGIAVLESDFCDDHGDVCGFEIIKQKKYGRTYITVYKKTSD